MAEAQFEIFVDGGCGLCSKEAQLMAQMDGGRGRLQITDISAPDFDPGAIGVTYDEAMRSILGRTPDGSVVRGVEVFRRAYAAIGYGWIMAPTAWPGIRQISDRIYVWFARWRYERRMREGCPIPTHTTE